MAAHLTKQELLELVTMYNEGVRPLHIAKKINRETFEEAERKFQTGEYTITSD